MKITRVYEWKCISQSAFIMFINWSIGQTNWNAPIQSRQKNNSICSVVIGSSIITRIVLECLDCIAKRLSD